MRPTFVSKKRTLDGVRLPLPPTPLKRSSAMRYVKVVDRTLAELMGISPDGTHIYYFETAQNGDTTHFLVNDSNFADIRVFPNGRGIPDLESTPPPNI